MAQIGEVTFLPKEAPWEGCLPWWLWCTPSTICLHGAGASGGAEWSSPPSLPPGSLPLVLHGSYLHQDLKLPPLAPVSPARLGLRPAAAGPEFGCPETLTDVVGFKVGLMAFIRPMSLSVLHGLCWC